MGGMRMEDVRRSESRWQSCLYVVFGWVVVSDRELEIRNRFLTEYYFRHFFDYGGLATALATAARLGEGARREGLGEGRVWKGVRAVSGRGKTGERARGAQRSLKKGWKRLGWRKTARGFYCKFGKRQRREGAKEGRKANTSAKERANGSIQDSRKQNTTKEQMPKGL